MAKMRQKQPGQMRYFFMRHAPDAGSIVLIAVSIPGNCSHREGPKRGPAWPNADTPTLSTSGPRGNV